MLFARIMSCSGAGPLDISVPMGHDDWWSHLLNCQSSAPVDQGGKHSGLVLQFEAAVVARISAILSSTLLYLSAIACNQTFCWLESLVHEQKQIYLNIKG